MHARLPSVIGAAVFASLSAFACGGGSSGYPTGSGGQNPPPGGQPPPPSTSSAVTVRSNHFDPSATTVAVNTTVTWTWNACSDDGYGGQTCVDHNVTFDGGTGSGNKSSGTYSRQFTSGGTFNYECTIHAVSGMRGQVVVR